MEEMVAVFLDANRLRRTVISEIIDATNVYQGALFLEALSQFLVGFRDPILLAEFERCNMPILRVFSKFMIPANCSSWTRKICAEKGDNHCVYQFVFSRVMWITCHHVIDHCFVRPDNDDGYRGLQRPLDLHQEPPSHFNLDLLSNCSEHPLFDNFCPCLANHGLGHKTHNKSQSRGSCCHCCPLGIYWDDLRKETDRLPLIPGALEFVGIGYTVVCIQESHFQTRQGSVDTENKGHTKKKSEAAGAEMRVNFWFMKQNCSWRLQIKCASFF
ncbi:hypothetical protein SLEP1_g24243 [Rubroshorea leprosula]|uniref:Uncharacterized protein n=1 Tax=Rubroshorea leprosula TaxID=152421 RepID=A0AAV5JPI4_9ROSI|nr:hypothetical protein SLEP1_g24243 [Rubroshorea leprosula]